jgi:hypothetical protein
MRAEGKGLSIFLLIICLAFSSGPVFAESEVPTIEWNKTYGGRLNDLVHQVQETSDGGFILAGDTRSFDLNEWEAYLIKTDSNGNELWSKTYDPSHESDRAYSIQQTPGGGFIVAGKTDYGRGYNVYFLRTDSTGTEMWSQFIGGQDYDYANSVQLTSDGGYIVAGGTKSLAVKRLGSIARDWYLIKIAGNGEKIWHRIYGGDFDDYANSAQQTSDGGFIIAGSKHSLDPDGVNLVKTDSEGNLLWKKALGPADFNAHNVQETVDGGYIIAGANEDTIYLLKTGSNGVEVWSRTFGSPEDVRRVSVQQTRDGGYVVVAKGGREFVKTDSKGNEVWSKYFKDTRISSIKQTSDGGYILAGVTRAFGPGLDDIHLIKLGAESRATQPQTPLKKSRVVVLTNSIDYDYAADFLDFLEERGFEVALSTAENFEQYKDQRLIVILGGPDASEGVGKIVRSSGILGVADSGRVRESGSKGKFVAIDPWERMPSQVVWVLAGSDREQTKNAHLAHRSSIVEEMESSNVQPQIKVIDTQNPCPPNKDFRISHSPQFAALEDRGDIYICDVVYGEDPEKWSITIYNQGDQSKNIYKYELSDAKRSYIITIDFPGPNYWITPPHKIILPSKGYWTVKGSTFNPGAISGPYSAGINLKTLSGTLILHDEKDKIIDMVKWG